MIPLLMLSLEVSSLSVVKDWPPVFLLLESLRLSLRQSEGAGLSKFEIERLRKWARIARNTPKNVLSFLNDTVAYRGKKNRFSGAYTAANGSLWAIFDGYNIPDFYDKVLQSKWRDLYGYECPYIFTPKGLR